MAGAACEKTIGISGYNLAAVLSGADMNLANIARLTGYTTDVNTTIQNFDLLGMRFGPRKGARKRA